MRSGRENAGGGDARRLAAAAVLVAACGSSAPDADDVEPASTTTQPVIAAVTLASGDCVDGVVIGNSERSRIEQAQLGDCQGDHDVELYAQFDMPFEQDYPGIQRVVSAAEEGCSASLRELTVETDVYGILAFWPTAESWADGDRTIVCGAFPKDGSGFSRPTLVG